MSETLSLEESFHNALFYFAKALKVLSLSASAQRATMDNVHVAWEIQHDVLDNGQAVRNSALAPSIITPEMRRHIDGLLARVQALPVEALSEEATEAMEHPAWSELRANARELLDELHVPLQINRGFFNFNR